MNEYSYLEWSHVSLHTHLYDITARLACTHTGTRKNKHKPKRTLLCTHFTTVNGSSPFLHHKHLLRHYSYLSINLTHTHAYAQVLTIATLSHWSCIQLSRTRGPHGMTDHITAFTFFNGPAGHKRAGGGR